MILFRWAAEFTGLWTRSFIDGLHDVARAIGWSKTDSGVLLAGFVVMILVGLIIDLQDNPPPPERPKRVVGVRCDCDGGSMEIWVEVERGGAAEIFPEGSAR